MKKTMMAAIVAAGVLLVFGVGVASAGPVMMKKAPIGAPSLSDARSIYNETEPFVPSGTVVPKSSGIQVPDLGSYASSITIDLGPVEPWSKGVLSNDIEDYMIGMSPDFLILYGKTMVPFETLKKGSDGSMERHKVRKYCEAVHVVPADRTTCEIKLGEMRIFPLFGDPLGKNAYQLFEGAVCEAFGDQTTGPLYGFRCTIVPLRMGRSSSDFVYLGSDTIDGLRESRVLIMAGADDDGELVVDVSPDLFAPYLFLKGYVDMDKDGVPDQLE